MLERKSVVLAKVETNYGEDPTPTASANAILVSDLDIQVKGDPKRRNIYRNTLSKLPYVRGGIKSVDVTFTTEIKGTGTVGTVPGYGWEGTLFRGCGMVEAEDATSPAIGSIKVDAVGIADETFRVGAQTFTFKASRGSAGQVTIGATLQEQRGLIATAINLDVAATVTATTDYINGDWYVIVTAVTEGPSGNDIIFTESTADVLVMDGGGKLGGTELGDNGLLTYTPISDSMESVTLYVYKDGLFHIITGCRGSFKINLEVDNYGTITWNFSGIYISPVDDAPAPCTFSQIVPPPVLGIGLSLDSGITAAYAPVATKIEIDMKNKLAARKSVNSSTGLLEWIISDREPVGSFDPEAVLEATYPFWGNWEDASQHFVRMDVGDEAENICIIRMPIIQLDELKYGNRDGILTYQIPFSLASDDDGDDELTIIYK